MSNVNNKDERRHLQLCYEGKFFVLGALIGSLLVLFWNYMFRFEHSVHDPMIAEIRVDSDHMLLTYIDGRWESSLKDLILIIDIDYKKEMIVTESPDGKTTSFKIVEIKDINGIFGMLTIDVCDVDKECTSENIIPIRVNKVFGVDRAITVSYDSRFAKCAEYNDLCVRGFRRH